MCVYRIYADGTVRPYHENQGERIVNGTSQVQLRYPMFTRHEQPPFDRLVRRDRERFYPQPRLRRIPKAHLSPQQHAGIEPFVVPEMDVKRYNRYRGGSDHHAGRKPRNHIKFVRHAA